MSELMHARNGSRDFRWHLLTTVSSLALFASLYGTRDARAEDADRPTVWVELGGQLEQMQASQEPLAPPFVANLPNNFFSPLNVQRPAKFAIGEDASISFEPEGSDWVLSASIQYGRANASRHQHQQTPNPKVPVHFTYAFPPPLPTINPIFFAPRHYNYSFYPFGHFKLDDATARKSETHAILDFQAGKDVGLGLFGRSGSSVLSAGIRIAQFTSKASVSLRAEPDVHYLTAPITSKYELYAWRNKQHAHFHDYTATLTAQRSFRGLGPSIAWNGSAPFVGNSDRGEITLDWGANAAVLFGRQKVHGRHQTNARGYYGSHWYGYVTASPKPGGFFKSGEGGGRVQTVYAHAVDINRSRTVIVPNLGGMVGLSFLYSSAKVSFGYRSDFFFGAMDGGIDTAKSENRGFFGPFATISVGLGG